MAPRGAPSTPAVAELLRLARALADDVAREAASASRSAADGERLRRAEARLRRSVIGPLERASAQGSTDARTSRPPPGARAGSPRATVAERLWRLAREATRLRTAPAPTNELLEATAALQDLAPRFALDDEPARAG